jgi:TRAP transporter TAXI family solute receptor
MRKNFVCLMVVFVLIVGVILVVGCGDKAGEPKEGEQNGDASGDALPSLVGLATSGVGSGGHTSTVAFATELESYLGVPVRIMPAWSPAVNLTQVIQGHAHIVGGGSSQGSYYDAVMGRDVFANHEWGPQDLTVVWYNYTAPYGIVTRGNTGIEKIEDLKGKKGAVYLSSPSWYTGFLGCLAFGGLTADDVEIVEVGGYSDVARAVAEGRADFTYLYTGSAVTYEMAENPHGIKWVPMPLEDEEGWAKYFELNPLYGRIVSEKGVEESHGVPMGNHPFIWWTYKDVNEELVYRVVKFLVEEHDKYKDNHPDLADMSLESMLAFIEEGIGGPLHPGTVRYLKEIGKWSDEDEAWNNKQWQLIENLRAAWDDAIEEAIDKGIEPSSGNKAWIEIWEKHRDQCEPIRRRSS